MIWPESKQLLKPSLDSTDSDDWHPPFIENYSSFFPCFRAAARFIISLRETKLARLPLFYRPSHITTLGISYYKHWIRFDIPFASYRFAQGNAVGR